MKKYEYMVIYSLNNGIGRMRIISKKFIKSASFFFNCLDTANVNLAIAVPLPAA